LPDTANYILAGDCNIYGSYESAYTTLLNTSVPGYFIDPLQDSLSGTWNNVLYSCFHTQSTRVRSFGGGTTGGLDDRFDMILFSQAVNDAGGMEYLSGSTTAYGNDSHHFNDSINAPPNSAVSETLADALHFSSDHIPVIAKFIFPKAKTDTVITDVLQPAYDHFIIYPNPAKDQLTIKGAENCENIFIKNIAGKIVLQTSPHTEILDISMLPDGMYIINLQYASALNTYRFIKMK
jgi:hypothetical protein